MKISNRSICLVSLALSLLACAFTAFIFFTGKPYEEHPIAKPIQKIPEVQLLEVPHPKLDELEKMVRENIQEKLSHVQSIKSTTAEERKEHASAFGELGLSYHAYHFTDSAEACYRNAQILDPENLYMKYALGYLLQSMGKFPEAIENYRQAALSTKHTYLVQIRLGECYRSLNQLGRARKSFEAALQNNPDGLAVLARLGEIDLAEKNFHKAVEHLESVLKKRPEANRLHYPLAMAYRGLGEKEKSKFHLAKHGKIGIQPPDPFKEKLLIVQIGYRAYNMTGMTSFKSGRYEEAAELFRKAIEVEPDDVGPRVNLGSTLVKLNQPDEAMAQFREAIRIAPDNENANYNLGFLLSDKGNYSEAVNHLRTVLKKQPNDAKTHMILANALRNSNSPGEAFEHYKKAVRENQAMVSGWLGMSSLLTLAGQHGEALQVLEEAHKRLPLSGPIGLNLAHLLATSSDLSKRNGKRSLDLAKKAFEAEKHYKSARVAAMAYAELDLCDNAVEWQERAISLASQPETTEQTIKMLGRNLEHYKSKRPCRVPGN